MRGIIEPSVKSIETLALSYFNAYKYCFCADSTEKWVRMYASKRWDTLNAIQKDDYNNELTPRLRIKMCSDALKAPGSSLSGSGGHRR